MRRFLRYELGRYLSGRGGEAIEGLPLYRVENQPYMPYRKDSLVFYRLREEIGEDALNRALGRFLRGRPGVVGQPQARHALTAPAGRRRAAHGPAVPERLGTILAGGAGGFRVDFAPFSARLPPRKGYVSQVARRIA